MFLSKSVSTFLFAAAFTIAALPSSAVHVGARKGLRTDEQHDRHLGIPNKHGGLFSYNNGNASPPKRDVCVIGGGAAGVYATKLLEDKGYSAVLFDNADSLGGKTLPPEIDVNGSSVSVFRHILSSDMVLVNQLIEDFGLDHLKEIRKDYYRMLSEEPFSVFPRPVPSPEIQAAVGEYFELWAFYDSEYDGILTNPNHDGVPQELMVPAAGWFESNNIIPALYAFYNGISNFGYSFFDEIPIIYLLKYLSPTKFLEGGITWFPFNELLERIGSTLFDVHSNTEVTRLKALDEDKWGIFISGNNKGKMFYKCDKVVLAFPPTVNALEMIEDLEQATTELLSNVKTVAYWEYTIEGLPPCSAENPQPCIASHINYGKLPTASDAFAPSFNIPNYYYRLTNQSALISTFNAGIDDGFSQEDVFDVVRGHLHAAFGYDPNAYNITIFKKHPYFPHVGSQAMMDGFYSDLEDIQGNQGLYFTGGFRDFELVDLAMRTTEDLLDKHFPSKL